MHTFVAILATAAWLGAAAADSFYAPLDRVVAELDRYASLESAVSQLDGRELRNTVDMYAEMTDSERLKFVKKRPENKLFVDLAIVPLLRMPELMDSEPSLQAFVRRLLSTYKKVRPAHQNMLVQPAYAMKSRYLYELWDRLDQDGAPVPREMLVRALKEYNGFKRTLDAIPEHEDIYAMLDDYMKMYNTINQDKVSDIANRLFERLDESSSQSQIDAQVAKFRQRKSFW